MRMNLKNVIKVRTLANGQFEVRTGLSEKKPAANSVVQKGSETKANTNSDQEVQNILMFRSVSK